MKWDRVWWNTEAAGVGEVRIGFTILAAAAATQSFPRCNPCKHVWVHADLYQQNSLAQVEPSARWSLTTTGSTIGTMSRIYLDSLGGVAATFLDQVRADHKHQAGMTLL